MKNGGVSHHSRHHHPLHLAACHHLWQLFAGLAEAVRSAKQERVRSPHLRHQRLPHHLRN